MVLTPNALMYFRPPGEHWSVPRRRWSYVSRGWSFFIAFVCLFATHVIQPEFRLGNVFIGHSRVLVTPFSATRADQPPSWGGTDRKWSLWLAWLVSANEIAVARVILRVCLHFLNAIWLVKIWFCLITVIRGRKKKEFRSFWYTICWGTVRGYGMGLRWK